MAFVRLLVCVVGWVLTHDARAQDESRGGCLPSSFDPIARELAASSTSQASVLGCEGDALIVRLRRAEAAVDLEIPLADVAPADRRRVTLLYLRDAVTLLERGVEPESVARELGLRMSTAEATSAAAAAPSTETGLELARPRADSPNAEHAEGPADAPNTRSFDDAARPLELGARVGIAGYLGLTPGLIVFEVSLVRRRLLLAAFGGVDAAREATPSTTDGFGPRAFVLLVGAGARIVDTRIDRFRFALDGLAHLGAARHDEDSIEPSVLSRNGAFLFAQLGAAARFGWALSDLWVLELVLGPMGYFEWSRDASRLSVAGSAMLGFTHRVR